MKTLLTAAFVILLACDVRAGCFEPRTLDELASQDSGQRVTYTGRTSDNEVLRVYHDPETGEWTLTLIRRQGEQTIECEITDGENWRGPVECEKI